MQLNKIKKCKKNSICTYQLCAPSRVGILIFVSVSAIIWCVLRNFKNQVHLNDALIDLCKVIYKKKKIFFMW